MSLDGELIGAEIKKLSRNLNKGGRGGVLGVSAGKLHFHLFHKSQITILYVIFICFIFNMLQYYVGC